MEANMKWFMRKVKKILWILLNSIGTLLYKIRMDIISSYHVFQYSNSKMEERMSKKEEAKKVAEEVVTALKEEAKVEVAVQVDLSAVKHAYSLIENNGQYHVISVEFDPNTLVSGKVKKIESNTEKFLMQERLQVLLMGDDLV
jgi:hypothetical protein